MGSEWCSMFAFVFFLKIPRPPRSTRTYTLCPTRRSSDLQRQDRPGRRRAGRGVQAQAGERARHPRDRRGGVGKNRRGGGIGRRTIISITLSSVRAELVEAPSFFLREQPFDKLRANGDRKSTRLNSSH